MSEPAAAKPSDRKVAAEASVGVLAFAALGVVFGDLGTSPLYTLAEGFSGPYAMPVTRENILGVLSLIFWSLNFVVSFKYIGMVMKADNRGEGGIMALLALVFPGGRPKGLGVLLMVGLFGTALLYGDGMITPAITVLSALEGLSFKTELFEPYVVPLAVLILSLLFWVQHRGTARIGKLFGPVTLIWFICIGALGVAGIFHNPNVLAAVNPWHAVIFFQNEGLFGIIVLAAVVLALTGAEALYADMGHFGSRPIRLAWFGLVLPALVLNYFGQGAWLLAHPAAATSKGFSPFYALVPHWAIYPVIVIATSAAIVASQALISGVYSLTQQAMQLGFAPRMKLIHTSHHEKGQIYMPGVNAALWIACVALVLTFRSADALAAAYGVAVAGTMFTTSILFAWVMRARWGWPWMVVILLTLVFVGVDAAFLGANLVKVPHGGWVPILIAVLVYLLMATWKSGRRQVSALLRESALPLDLFLADLAERKLLRVPGVAVFMTAIPSVAPPVLLHHIKHNKVLHEKVMLMTIIPEDIPQVPESERITVDARSEGFFEVVARYGFMETPDVPSVIEVVGPKLQLEGEEQAEPLQLNDITFYLGRETLILRERGHGIAKPAGAMAAWRARLFRVMSRNAQSAAAFLGLPPNRVVELGAQIQI